MTRQMLEKPDIDLARLRPGRLERLRAELRRAEIPLCILVNPVSLRYAVDHREYALFQSHIPTCTRFVAAEGPVVMHGAYIESAGLVDEYRPSHSLNTFDGGVDPADQARRLAGEVKDFLRDIGIGDSFPRVAAERLNPSATQALLQSGLEVGTRITPSRPNFSEHHMALPCLPRRALGLYSAPASAAETGT